MNTIRMQLRIYPDIFDNQVDNSKLARILPALRMMLSEGSPKVLKFRANSLSDNYIHSKEAFARVKGPFCYDHVKHGEGRYLYIDFGIDYPDFLGLLKKEIETFMSGNGYLPKVILIFLG